MTSVTGVGKCPQCGYNSFCTTYELYVPIFGGMCSACGYTEKEFHSERRKRSRIVTMRGRGVFVSSVKDGSDMAALLSWRPETRHKAVAAVVRYEHEHLDRHIELATLFDEEDKELVFLRGRAYPEWNLPEFDPALLLSNQ